MDDKQPKYTYFPEKDKNGNTIPKGKHLIQIDNNEFLVYEYYLLNKIVGVGAYGIVCSGVDKRNNQPVAIKKVRNAFLDMIDAQRVLREIQLLMFFKHQNIISLIDIIKPNLKYEKFDEIYLVFQLMNSDLEKVINSSQVLTDQHIKHFMYQMLSGTYYLHSANVIHRDFQPNNLLVNKNCHLKIADLNLARKYQNMNVITMYVVTRWYRAPQILLSKSDYTKAIDIWSIGCIFAELLGRTALFQGEHFLNQLQCIIALLGTPTQEDLPYSKEETTMKFVNSLSQREQVKWEDLFKSANPLAIDLLSKMIVYNPYKRLTAEQCLNHPYFAQIPDYGKLDPCQEIFDWKFDQVQLEKKQIQKAIYQEAIKFHQDQGNDDYYQQQQLFGEYIYQRSEKELDMSEEESIEKTLNFSPEPKTNINSDTKNQSIQKEEDSQYNDASNINNTKVHNQFHQLLQNTELKKQKVTQEEINQIKDLKSEDKLNKEDNIQKTNQNSSQIIDKQIKSINQFKELGKEIDKYIDQSQQQTKETQ